MDLGGSLDQRKLRLSGNRGDDRVDPNKLITNVVEIVVIYRENLPAFGSETWIGLSMESVSQPRLGQLPVQLTFRERRKN